MKKILSIIISLSLMLGMISLLSGCGDGGAQGASSATAMTESDTSSEMSDTHTDEATSSEDLAPSTSSEAASVASSTSSKKPSSVGTSSSKKVSSTASVNKTSSTKPSQSTATSSKATATSSTSKKEPDIDPIRARYNADEPNGYSIWWSSEGNDYCVDYNGYKTFTFDDDEDNDTNVYNGSVITSIYSNDKMIYRLRRASDGKILFTTDSVGGASVIIPEHYGEEMFKDGYVLVYSKTESYNGVSYKLGFVDSNGKWVVPLSSDNPILKTIGDDASADYFKKQLYYCRDGILAFELDNDICYLYNIKTNSIAKIQSSENLRDDNISSIIKCGLTFKDGLAVEMYSLYASFGGANRCCKIYSNGKTENFALNFNENCHQTFGSKYYDSKTNSVITMGYTYHVDGFSLFDSNGNIIKKIDNVDVTDATGFKSDGTAQLVFENKEGSKYYTVIDTKGNFLFDPIKMSVTEIWDTNRYSVDCVDTNSVRQGEYAVVDNTGKILFQTTEWVYDFNYQNGIVYYETDLTKRVPHYVEIKK